MSTEALPPVAPRLPQAEVGFGDQVATGGASTVFSMLGVRKFLVFKKYTARRNPADLDKLVSAYAAMDAKAKTYVRQHLAWPIATVAEDDQAVGALVLRAGDEFQLTLPGGRTRVRDLNFLLYEKRAERIGVPRATDLQKVGILQDLVTALSWLGHHGFVHEDLAAHNVLWKLDPLGIFVLDCDSLRVSTDESRSPLYTTVDWTDPRVLTAEVERPDQASTSYALGLLVPRVLVSPYWYPGDPLPPERLPPALEELVVRASGDADDRPSLKEWERALEKAASQTTGTIVEPVPVGKPSTRGRTADRWAFALGLFLGAVLAVIALKEFI